MFNKRCNGGGRACRATVSLTGYMEWNVLRGSAVHVGLRLRLQGSQPSMIRRSTGQVSTVGGDSIVRSCKRNHSAPCAILPRRPPASGRHYDRSSQRHGGGSEMSDTESGARRRSSRRRDVRCAAGAKETADSDGSLVRMQCSSQLPLGHMRTPVIRTRRSPTRRPARRRPGTTTRQKPHLVAGPKRREQDRRPASTGGARAQPVPNRREWPGGRRHPTSQSRCLPADAKTTAKRERESWKVAKGCRMPFPRNSSTCSLLLSSSRSFSSFPSAFATNSCVTWPLRARRLDHDTTRVA